MRSRGQDPILTGLASLYEEEEEEILDLGISRSLSTHTHTHTHTQKKGHPQKTQQESGHLQARKRGLTLNQPGQHPDLGLAASRLRANKCVPFELPSLWHSVMAARAD